MGHQLSISLELILLLDWLLKHDKDRLRLLVRQALERGLLKTLEKNYDHNYMKKVNQLHETVLDFIIFLEDSLLEGVEHLDSEIGLLNMARQREHMEPIMQVLHDRALDAGTLWLSIQRAKKGSGAVTEKEAKRELCKKLLKNWDPTGNEPVN